MCYWKTKRKIIYRHFLIAELEKRDWFSKHILSFMKSDGKNCKSSGCSPVEFSSGTNCKSSGCSPVEFSSGTNCKSSGCSPVEFSSFQLKMTLLLCFLSLNLTITFSSFFIRWQAWRSSDVIVVSVKESAWHTLFSKSAEGID